VYEIIEKRTLNPTIKLFVVKAPLVARRAEPGQFVMVRIHEKGERIPLTIADYNPGAGTVTIVVQEVGKTTALLGAMEPGDSLPDFLGPLGVPAELPTGGRVMCVGGGVGVAPVYPKAKAMFERGVEVISVIGARTAELLILEEEMRAVSRKLYVTTDDGSKGHHGFVTDIVDRLLREEGSYDEVIAVGPLVMMQAVARVTKPHGVKTWVSLNPIMVDGTGMCGACRVTVGGKTRFCCVDGPMFDGHEVDFEEAIRRARMYQEEETLAREQCRCGGEGYGG